MTRIRTDLTRTIIILTCAGLALGACDSTDGTDQPTATTAPASDATTPTATPSPTTTSTAAPTAAPTPTTTPPPFETGTPTPEASASTVATTAQDVIDDFARRLRDGGDVADLVSADGLWIAHHAPPVHYPNDQVNDAIDDTTTRQWGSNALDADSPENTPQTFKEAVADPFVSVWLDDDTTHMANQVQTGPNGRLEEDVIPSEFSDLSFVSALDPGDNPNFGGLDWQMWLVSVVSEDGQPRIFGLTLDEWAP